MNNHFGVPFSREEHIISGVHVSSWLEIAGVSLDLLMRIDSGDDGYLPHILRCYKRYACGYELRATWGRVSERGKCREVMVSIQRKTLREALADASAARSQAINTLTEVATGRAGTSSQELWAHGIDVEELVFGPQGPNSRRDHFQDSARYAYYAFERSVKDDVL